MARGLVFGMVGAAVLSMACGGSPRSEPMAAPPQPTAAPAPPPKPAEPAAPLTPAAGPAEPTPNPAPETPAPVVAPAPEPEPKRSQSPIVMITSRDAAFLVDYASTKAKERALTACETEAKGDAEKQSTCLGKARDKFMPDVLRFRKDSETKTSLVIYKRNASSLRELWVGSVVLSEPSSDTVKVKFGGSQKGARPLWRGRSEVVITVPNEYSLEFDDPELGHLRYDAKVGLITQ